ncbi:TetR/AcrR family transcriptional regulator (plasmid) [Caulobacter sp. FWC26]|jgi:AcrR family transcriptional regulator|nr:TetR/AcrR family transcriptional regulator [Caulobacter sp. FWC26]PIB90004.1 TetR family transcriptional regulator [Caulobacter sp. FWC2]
MYGDRLVTTDNINLGVKARGRSSSKADTIARLLEAARREFAINGIARANMETIARSAGVTKQLLYQYYESKHHLFSAVLDQTSGVVMTELLATNFDDLPPVQALQAFTDAVFDQYRVDPLLGRLAREGLGFHEDHHSSHNRFIQLKPALAQKLEGILRRGEACGDFRQDLDVRATLALISLVMTGGFTNSYLLSVILERDTATGEGREAWRRMASEFVLEAIRRKA